MKHLRQCNLFIHEEIIINILNRLPLKSLARFKCISYNWQKCIAEIYRCRLGFPEPYLIGFFCVEKRLRSRFFFTSKESPLLIGTTLDKSIDFIGIGEGVYVVASSNGIVLCNRLRSRHRVYYVYNPATRQRLDVPKTLIRMNDPYVGFTCKVDEDHGIVSFTIVRYVIRKRYQSSITIESYSSETNVWIATDAIHDLLYPLQPSRDENYLSSCCVIDGVFCWIDNFGQGMTVYDSVKKCFWGLAYPQPGCMIYPGFHFLGLSGGELCFASKGWTIPCWRLNNFPSRDAEWVWKYNVDVVTIIQKCGENFGLGGGNVQNIVFHPVFPDILFLQINGKVISYDVKTSTVELVYDFGEAGRKTKHYKLFSYEWPQWPRLK
ncbi:hypothetical protein AABB24_018952 [Solanum stoloniferum]|uniref:F-box domain-containing protein n=1 Tax=Solanum stoloniferum TaxID=62892 RepID=A0ABD2TDV7_9SOLN